MLFGTEEFNTALLRLITDKKAGKHSCYTECVQHAEDMAVHVYGNKPTEILERVRPREDPAVTKYRIDSWEPITKSTAHKGISIVGKMANPTLYNIRPNEEGTEAKNLYKYAMEEYPGFKSVVNYFFETGLQKMVADPNGVFAIRPELFPNSDTERVKPIIKLYGSKNVWNFDVEHYLIFIREEQTEKITTYWFEYYDKNQVIEFRAYTTNAKDVVVDPVKVYTTNFDKIPVWELKGMVETLDNGAIIYKSFFDAALPYWNQVINHWSDMVGAFIQHIHPLRVEASVECDYIDGNKQRCTSGYLVNPDGGARTSCPSCGGSGVKGMLNSPFGVIRVNIDQFKNESTGNTSGISPVTFVNVPTEATQMLKDHCKELLEMGLNSLNMDIVNRIGENQSGRAKVIDRGELYDFLYKISSVVFDTHIFNFFFFFNGYMYGVEAKNLGKDANKNMPMISKPVQFDISTAQELMAEFEQAKKAGASPNYLKVKQKQVNAKEFATDPDLRDKMNLILDLDPLPDMPVDDLIAQSGQAWVDAEDLVIHANIGQFVDRAMQENKGFGKMPREKQNEILEGYATELAAENKDRIAELNPDSDADSDKDKDKP